MPVLRPLHSGWTLRAAGPAPLGDGPVPATVPGCVHTDLLAAGLIPDPYLDDNELGLAWIGRTSWVYETAFDAALGRRSGGSGGRWAGHGGDGDLNGVELGRTANMHRGYRFDVREVLLPVGNRLEVRFDSAYDYASQVRDRSGSGRTRMTSRFSTSGRWRSNFGWDWGPTLVTAGIWQRIGLAGVVAGARSRRSGRWSPSTAPTGRRRARHPGTGRCRAADADRDGRRGHGVGARSPRGRPRRPCGCGCRTRGCGGRAGTAPRTGTT